MTTTAVVNRREFAPIVIPDGQILVDAIKEDLEEASDFDVCSEMMAGIAQQMAGRIATVIDELDEQRLAATLPLRDGQKWVNDGYNATIDSLKGTVADLKTKLTAWNKKVAADRAAAEKVERERREKVAREAAAVAEAERQAAVKLLADADALAATGNTQAASDLFDQATVKMDTARETLAASQQAQAAPVRTNVGGSGVKGASKTWKARVLDKQKLVLAAANRPEFMAMVDINEANLNAYAKLHKGLVPIPGVEFYEEDVQRVSKRPV